jgi:c-di-GMP-related signal transduction protein
MIIRVDCDYPYNLRLKNFLSVFLRTKLGKGYLANAKEIARIVNNSKKDIHVIWFVTNSTIPDNEFLQLINNSKHEIGLHAVSNVESELLILSSHLKKLGYKKQIHYFNQHGVKRLLSKIVWHKFTKGLQQQCSLKYFGVRDWVCLDALCYEVGQSEAFKIASKYDVLYFHPDWLDKTGILNHRGRYKDVLIRLLNVSS